MISLCLLIITAVVVILVFVYCCDCGVTCCGRKFCHKKQQDKDIENPKDDLTDLDKSSVQLKASTNFPKPAS